MEYLRLFQEHSGYTEYKNSEGFLKPNVSHCVNENEVHYTSLYDPYNKHAYVDLGLASGTKWAKMNVGASSETDNGLYFAWGETQGYTDASTKAFSWSDYKYGAYNSRDTNKGMTKYNITDGLTELDAEDDAAHVNMGGDWHMPNRAQCLELFSGTSNGFITSGGIYTQYNWSDESSTLQPDTSVTASTSAFNSTAGHIFFNKSYASVTDAISAEDYLFIPAAGYCYYDEVVDIGESVHVWSSSLYTDNVSSAWGFYFGSDEAGVSDYNRCSGPSVRGVVGQINESSE